MSVEKYTEQRQAFLDEIHNLRPDLFLPISWSEDKKSQVAEMVKPSKIRTGIFASIPLICRAEQCVYADICPLQKQHVAPKNFPCPLEMSLVHQFVTEYMEELGVDPENLIEVSMVRDLVDQEIQQQRTTWLLSLQHFIQDNVVGVSSDGTPIAQKQLHLAVDLQDRLHRRKKDLRNQLLATREARAKVGRGDVDSAVAIAKVMDEVRAAERAETKALMKRLGYEDRDDYIEAEVVDGPEP